MKANEPGTAISLTSLRVGQSARIAGFNGSSAFDLRLLDLGFVPGSTVRVRRFSPLRDPIEYEIRNSRICLRRSEASRILVTATPLESPESG